MFKRTLTLLVVLATAPAAVRGQVHIGPEFRVNSYTSGAQQYPAVAADADGNFIVVWEGDGQDGSGLGAFGRWHDASGVPLGAAEVRVNAYTSGNQLDLAVASTPEGGALVVWTSFGQDGSHYGIFARRYASAEAPPGPEFQVNTYTMQGQRYPAVAAASSGFVVVWQSHSQDGSQYGVVGRRYDALGQSLGGEFLVNSTTVSAQAAPAVAADAAGNFVVVWHGSGPGDTFGIFARRYDAGGVSLGGEFRVNSYTTGSQLNPVVASDPAGNFVVAWVSGQDGTPDVWAQRYAAAGSPLGGAFRVNDYTSGEQDEPAIAIRTDGGFVVTWTSNPQDGHISGVFGRWYDPLGAPAGGIFQVNTYTTDHQMRSVVAPDANGGFVTAWSSYLQDGNHWGVFGQRIKPDVIFADGFEDGTLDAWSAVSTDGGDLSVSTLAGLNFTTAGLRGVVDDTVGIYVQDDSPDGEGRYRARFYFDPNSFDPGESNSRFRTRIFIAFSEAPMRRVAAIVLRRLGGEYSIRGRARRDDNSQADTPFIPITDAPHVVEFDLERASGPGAADGHFEMSIDGSQVSFLSPLENSLASVDLVRMGALSVKPGANGTMYWDEFESRRQEPIGP